MRSQGGVLITLVAVVSIATPAVVEAQPPPAPAYTFSTIWDGSGASDGVGTNAQFNAPRGIAVDTSGNVYVADTLNQTIRKITAGGVVTTFAGLPGVGPIVDGAGSAARFASPSSVSIASDGTLYVPDGALVLGPTNLNFFGCGIRRISTNGTVATVIPPSACRGQGEGHLGIPSDVVADAAGNLFVADVENFVIAKITPAGVVSTFAGSPNVRDSVDGVGSAARFVSPAGIAIDAAGNLYVADSLAHTIRKITPGAQVTTLAGAAGIPGNADGTGSAARFTNPGRLAVVADGTLYIADSGNHTIRRVTAAGVVTTLAGSAGVRGSADGTGSGASFNLPSGIAVDANGLVWVADTGNDLIRTVTQSGVVTTVAGATPTPSSGQGILVAPAGVAVNGFGRVVFSDTGLDVVRRVILPRPVGTLTLFEIVGGAVGVPGSVDGTTFVARFNGPTGLALDAAGFAFIADTANHTIRKAFSVDPNFSAVTTMAGVPGSPGAIDGSGAAARFNLPRAVAVDAAGVLYVADSGNHTIRRIAADGTVSTLAGFAGSSGSADGSGSAARFSSPSGIAVDSTGTLFVADTGNHTIRRITAAAETTTIAGAAGAPGSVDDVGTAARFSSPSGIAVDAGGTLYVADTGNDTIRAIAPDGTVTTIGGMAGVVGRTDGTGASARFSAPAAIAVDADAAVYVADTANNTIRIGVPGTAMAPMIVAQPVDWTARAGQTVTFRVAAAASPLAQYQWQIEVIDSGPVWRSMSTSWCGATTVSGAQTPTLTLTNVEGCFTGRRFRCVVTNIAGSVTSAAAALTVYSLTVNPISVIVGGARNAAGTLALVSPPQPVRVTYNGPEPLVWTVSSNQPWLTVSPGADAAQVPLRSPRRSVRRFRCRRRSIRCCRHR